ncbi:MAG: hypothetical protein KAT70_06895, partial [Thermoplasmata archaeon]|nr:hypothetical protein [Thermoplasmata archaeon]
MDPTLFGLLWFFPSIAIMVVIGILVFDREKRFNIKRAVRGAIDCRAYIALLFITLGLIKVENWMQDLNIFPNDFTYLFYNLEGNAYIVWLQQSIQNSVFIHTLSVFYILFFMWTMVFVAIFFLATDRPKLMKLYIYAITLNYIVLIPFYLFFNVSVTCHYPADTPVQPLLYREEMYLGLVTMADRLSDNFPSGHMSINWTIALVLLLRTEFKRLAWLMMLVTAITAFAILFLGIHWMM